MGSSRRYWFPLAALGFAQLLMVVVDLTPDEPVPLSTVYQPSRNLFGTSVVGTTYSATAVGVSAVPSATLGWLAGLACVVLAVAAWYWFSLRRAGTPPRPGRFVLGTLGALAVVPLLDLVGFLQLRWPGDVRGTLLATLGLLALAAYERSRLVAAVAGVSGLAGLIVLPPRAGALCSAGVLLAAAFAVLLRRPDDTAADTS